MTPAEIRAFRERVAQTWEVLGSELGKLLNAWETEDAPPDITTNDEWPVEMALEDWQANCYHAAAKIRENDETNPDQEVPPMDRDLLIWLDQNPIAAATINAEQKALAENFAEHHSGGLRVLGVFRGSDRYMKMHDSWGGEDKVVVHVYTLDEDGEDGEDPNEQIMMFDTGDEAFRVFLALAEMTDTPSKKRVTVTHTFPVPAYITEDQLSTLVGTMTAQVEEPDFGEGYEHYRHVDIGPVTSKFTTENIERGYEDCGCDPVIGHTRPCLLSKEPLDG